LTDEQFNITSLVGINIPAKGNNEGAGNTDATEGAITTYATNTCTVSLSHSEGGKQTVDKQTHELHQGRIPNIAFVPKDSLVTLLDHPAAIRGAAPDEPADHIVIVPKDSLVTPLDYPAALPGVHARVAAPDEPADHPTSQIGTGNDNGNDAHSTKDDTARAPIHIPTKEREIEGVGKTGTTSSASKPLPPLSARMAGVALRDAEGAPSENEGVQTPTSATNNQEPQLVNLLDSKTYLPNNQESQLVDLLDSETYLPTVAETKRHTNQGLCSQCSHLQSTLATPGQHQKRQISQGHHGPTQCDYRVPQCDCSVPQCYACHYGNKAAVSQCDCRIL
jgi:hypothetical protein